MTSTFFLPWPPSENHYRRAVRTKTAATMVKSPKARGYPALCNAALEAQGNPKFDGNIEVCIWATPPDMRKRDLDNLLKGTLDALTHCGVYKDDSKIRHITIGWLGVIDSIEEDTTPWQYNFIVSNRGHIKVCVSSTDLKLPWEK